MSSHKGPGPAPKLDGSALRIAILHSRWNPTIIDPLVAGTRKTLLTAGVVASNIVTESVPGAWELPVAAQRLYAASQIQSASSGAAVGSLGAGDLLGGGASVTDLTLNAGKEEEGSAKAQKGPFDAVVAIGCLIKGETMHFEYIAETVSRGLMRVQLDAGVPIVFGVLTVLKEEQARKRAGLDGGENHGESWGQAAVELGVKKANWAKGEL